MSDEQHTNVMNIDELKFQRRYVQVRLNELKQEREELVAKKQVLDTQLAERRQRKQESVATVD